MFKNRTSSEQLAIDISTAENLRSLAQILELNISVMNKRHFGAAYTKLKDYLPKQKDQSKFESEKAYRLLAFLNINLIQIFDDLDDTALAIICNALVRMESNDKSIELAAIAYYSSSKNEPQNVEPRHIAMLTNSLSKLEGAPGFDQAIMNLVHFAIRKLGLNNFNPQGIANLANALSKVKVTTPGFIDAMMTLVKHATSSSAGSDSKILAEYIPQAIVNLAHALSKVNPNTPGFANCMMILVMRASRSLGNYDAMGIANLANALSKVDPHFPGFTNTMRTLVEHASGTLEHYNPHDIANLANAFSKIDARTPGFSVLMMGLIKQGISKGLNQHLPRSIANLVNALSKIDTRTTDFIHVMMTLIQHAIPRLRDYDAQGISNLANALSKLNANVPGFTIHMMSLIRHAISTGLGDFSLQALTNLANALSKVQATTPGFDNAMMVIVQEAILKGLENYTPQAIANLANALSKVDKDVAGFTDAMIALVKHTISSRASDNQNPNDSRILDNYDPQQIANLANALSKVNANVSGFTHIMMILVTHASCALEAYDAQGIANIANALSNVDVDVPGYFSLMDGLLKHAISQDLEKNSLLHVVQLIYAVTISDMHQYDDILISRLLKFLKQDQECFSKEDKRQTLWFILNLKAKGRNCSEFEPYIPLLYQTEDKHIKSNSFEQSVRVAVDAVFPHVKDIQSQYFVIGSSVDIAIPSLKLIIEAQGPTHYCEKDPHKPNPLTRLKKRLLSAQEWQVLEIPYFEWRDKTVEEGKLYLRSLLKSSQISNAEQLCSEQKNENDFDTHARSVTMKFSEMSLVADEFDYSYQENSNPLLLFANKDSESPQALGVQDDDVGFVKPKRRGQNRKK